MNSPFSLLGALIPKWWKSWASALPKTRVPAEEAKTGSGHQKQKLITLQDCPTALGPRQIARLRFGQGAGRYWGDEHMDSAEFGPTTGTIPVGSVHGVMGYGDYAVYCKSREDGSGRVTYIIAHTPSIKASTEPPSSVLEEFTDQELAFYGCKNGQDISQRPDRSEPRNNVVGIGWDKPNWTWARLNQSEKCWPMNQYTSGIAARKLSDNKWQLLPFQIWKPNYLVCGWVRG